MSKSTRVVLGLGVVAALLIAGVWGTSLLWIRVGGGEMSGHGWAAMILGLIGTIVLSVGLMVLAFHSSKRGFDDRVDDIRNPEHERELQRQRERDGGKPD